MGKIDYNHYRNPKWACFTCRKSFRNAYERCPHCGGKQHFMGTHFKPPKQSHEPEWQAVEMLFQAGVRYEVFDLHFHGWSEVYRVSGHTFTEAELQQVLHENGVGSPNPTQWTWESRKQEWQWRGERPKHPRDVPKFLLWWHQRTLERIADVVEVCEKLNRQKPPIDEATLVEVQALLSARPKKSAKPKEGFDVPFAFFV